MYRGLYHQQLLDVYRLFPRVSVLTVVNLSEVVVTVGPRSLCRVTASIRASLSVCMHVPVLRVQSQVHIMWDEDLMNRPKDTLQGLFDFLDLPMLQLSAWDKGTVEGAINEVCVGCCVSTVACCLVVATVS